jgi:hypothetical protein
VYKLRLTAVDVAGRIAIKDTFIQVASSNKDARYLRNETDATVSLGGHTFALQRQYDSLRSGEDGTLGYGWRLPIRDFALADPAEPAVFHIARHR